MIIALVQKAISKPLISATTNTNQELFESMYKVEIFNLGQRIEWQGYVLVFVLFDFAHYLTLSLTLTQMVLNPPPLAEIKIVPKFI